jgi:hypothetical protein
MMEMMESEDTVDLTKESEATSTNKLEELPDGEFEGVSYCI